MQATRLDQFKTRAYEDMVALAMTNYAGAGWGHSVAYDGIAFADEGARNMLVVEAGEREGVYPAFFDLDALTEYRSREVHGNAFRRPSAYRPLVSQEISPEFVRVDRGGRAPRR
jgi:predicted amidohydrolase